MDPPVLLLELTSTAAGCDWLIRQWDRLESLLERSGQWIDTERDQAVRLLGGRPGDAEWDPRVMEVFRGYGGANTQYVYLQNEIQGVVHRAGGSGHWQRAAWVGEGLAEPDPAREALRALVRDERGRLAALREALLPRQAADVAGAADRALIDDSEAGARARRYESDCGREFHRSLRPLMAPEKGTGGGPRGRRLPGLNIMILNRLRRKRRGPARHPRGNRRDPNWARFVKRGVRSRERPAGVARRGSRTRGGPGGIVRSGAGGGRIDNLQ